MHYKEKDYKDCVDHFLTLQNFIFEQISTHWQNINLLILKIPKLT